MTFIEMEEDYSRKKAEAERTVRHENACFDAWWEGYKAALPSYADMHGIPPKVLAEQTEEVFRAARMALRKKIDEAWAPAIAAHEAIMAKRKEGMQ